MKIRKFNESREKWESESSIFDDKDKLMRFLGPISNKNLSIHYKCYKQSSSFDPYPITSQTKSGFNNKAWLRENRFFDDEHDGIQLSKFNELVKDRKIIRGIIIDIIEPKLVEAMSSDEQRGGRIFSKISPDMIDILEKIEDIKIDLETEGVTLGVYLSSYPKSHGATNFSSDAPISLLILDGDF